MSYTGMKDICVCILVLSFTSCILLDTPIPQVFLCKIRNIVIRTSLYMIHLKISELLLHIGPYTGKYCD